MSLLRRTGAIALIAVVTTAALSACTSDTSDVSPAASDTFTVETVYGDIEVPSDPDRVAAVSYDTPWQLMSLDIQPIATIDYSQWLDSYTQAQQDFIADAAVIGTYGEINFEALAATTPELIIGDAYEVDEAAFERLSSIAPTVILGGDDRGDWQSLTEQAAEATGTTDVWEASKAAYEELRDATKEQYREVIEQNVWINFSFGNEAGQFSVQLPTGATGNLVVTEMGLNYGAGAQIEDTEGSGYVSLPLDQIPVVFDGVTQALTFASTDGEIFEGIQEIIDSELFQSLPVAESGAVYGLTTSVTDYETAQDWINELTEKVLQPLSE
ncbi:ABC transporter substrate-binding protein [Homoserinibacter sp. GY 40078]|uniref:ABC transporter substrate-binding protein n=1 Tax=Homoserinibacter sp. GY 40078 TaxID=2603275 RepID=UPI0011C8FA8D|nr:ABC transporter substrate-binding protein [Homoserinibacter sp. GY 40078]TXK19903.1 ABC transporter substrate-binding protein [Homoserinibacter sp. GY 40078]